MKHYVLDARTATPHFPGIGRYCTSLSKALIPILREDERLTILCDADYPIDLPNRANVDSLPLTISPFSVRQQWAIPRILDNLKADVYHSAYYLMPYRPHVPSLVTFYDLIPVRFPQYSSWRAQVLFRLASNMALKTAKYCIAISKATMHDIKSYLRCGTVQIFTTPLAPATQFMPQGTDKVHKIRAKYNLPTLFTLYLGSNKPHKNLSALIEAYARVRNLDIPLVIAGTWLPHYPESRQLTTALGLDSTRIRWLGTIPGEDLPALYTAAQLFIFPSLAEGFGLPVIEAMACGTPVVCSNIPALTEVTEDAAALFDPTDIGSMTEAIRSIITDKVHQNILRQRGLKCVQDFSWQKTAQTTLNLYRQTTHLSFD
ncbi:MAG: glycosyltransferase family 1 protein [Anaerolineae bacterium]|nr:glycosyltransferase family 1 protein [Anaerolineae bacterium]